MARRPKRKAKKPENVRYEVAVHDWEPSYRFGLNIRVRDSEDVYWEHCQISLLGKLVSPAMEKVKNVRVDLVGDPLLDDHWSANPTIISAKAIGFSDLPRGDDTLQLYCSIPEKLFGFVSIAVSSGKIRHASVFGTKLRYRSGTVFSVSLQECMDEE